MKKLPALVMRKILALIAAIIGAWVFNVIFNAIFIIPISILIHKMGIASLGVGGALNLTGVTFNIFISIFVGYKIYKKFAKVKNTEI